MIDQSTQKLIDSTRAKYEFISFVVFKNNDFKFGIIQNETPKLIRMFDLGKITEPNAKARFLTYADEWWWERNQSMPIDSYFGVRFDEFQHTLRGFPKKSLLLDPVGPTFSFAEKYLKRIKKRRVDIINRVIPLQIQNETSRAKSS